mmetsp:Transcript_636/g.1507  ORF Transcript_636/g.1507 Transcript_636/m.1507 type:complete len:1305 (-) Transcript_636:136-4050(-)|eukprot:CAMPEP_0116148734 /NCGR_PEP_ID=MMETSP0329-20121206/18542_1 /TAXON_ID=697910 /ORGANISM="Pseudo-nitzschia arenysensis, Strain B593" /LENGTH=1304 /DNA_ID=CAMNT_0003644941 /DNA_START=33 /DNA_END=3947 /DNA_ORIENTATION=-
MSVASPDARPAAGMSSPKRKTLEIFAHMKLRAPNDPIVHRKISQWVAAQKAPAHIHPSKIAACRISSSLLLQRFVRAFENRLSSSSDDANKAKGSTAATDRSKPATPTNGNFATQAGSQKSTNFIRRPNKLPKKMPALSVLMQRKVKVTQLVKQAVQFVGSDVLKVLQVSLPSPTVADVANFCLSILNNENRIKEFYRIFSEASGKDVSPNDESSAIFFGVFALQALQSLRSQAISAYEFSHDFEMIYRTCYRDKNFQICMHELNPAMNPLEGVTSASFAPDTEARNICWKLARLLALKYDCTNKSNPDVKDYRRNHILLSATSIILAANIGKSVKNCEVSNPGRECKGTIPESEDFSALAGGPVSDLLNFLATNASQNQGITPIRNSDVLSHAMEACKLITRLGMGQHATGNMNSKSLLAKAFSPANHQTLLRDYRNIIKTLVTETQKELKIYIANPVNGDGAKVRTGIADVLLFFPMVIGEPWGIHRDAPMITSKMLCMEENSKPSNPLKDSVAVVMKMQPRPSVPKRKAEFSAPNEAGSIRTASKKAKTIPLIESPKKSSNKGSQGHHIDGDASASSDAKARISQKRGKSGAPFIDDASEVNEWTLSVLSLSVVKPTDSLLTYLGENDRTRGNGSSCLQDVIVPVLNRGALRIKNAIRSSSNLNSEATATTLSVGRRDGQVYVNGVVDNIVQLCAAIVGFYYYSLEAIIQDQMDRMDFFGSFGTQLQSRPFHRALLACCYSCILKGVGMYPTLQLNEICHDVTIQALLECTESDSFTFLKVIEAFSRALIATKQATQQQKQFPIVSGLPLTIYKHAQKIEAQLIDSLLWSTPLASDSSAEASFALSIKTMKSLPGAWPPDVLEPMLPEEFKDLESESSRSPDVRIKPSFGSSSEVNFVSFVLRKLLKFIFFRIRAICAALDLSSEGALHTQILVAFRYLLRLHISIFIDRHIDQLLLCTIYGVCRVMQIQPKITFGKVIDAYLSVRGEDQGDSMCRMIVRHVTLVSEGNENRSNAQAVGNIVVFYNTVYIPKMQKYFLESKSLKESTELYRQNCANKERCEEKNTSEKNLQTDAVLNGNGSGVVSQSSPRTDSRSRSIAVESGNNSVAKENTLGRTTVDLTKKDTFPDSSKDVPMTSGTSPVISKSIRAGELDPITSPPVVGDQAMNGQVPAGPEKADSKIDEGKSSKLTGTDNRIPSVVPNNSSEKTNITSAQSRNDHSLSSVQKNGTKANDSSIESDARKAPMNTSISTADDKKERSSFVPNVVDHVDKTTIAGSEKKGPQTSGETIISAGTNGTAATS